MNPQSKGRRILAWILTGLITVLFISSAGQKTIHEAHEICTKRI